LQAGSIAFENITDYIGCMITELFARCCVVHVSSLRYLPVKLVPGKTEKINPERPGKTAYFR
jgi:hypothetical protein